MTTTHESPMQTRFHPGEHLQMELDELQMSADDLAAKLNVRADFLKEFLAQKTSITGELALRLAHFFGTSAQMWLNMQNGYDIEQTSWRSGEEINLLPTLQAKAA